MIEECTNFPAAIKPLGLKLPLMEVYDRIKFPKK